MNETTREMGLVRGDSVLFHAPESTTAEELSNVTLAADSVRAAIGPSGTILVPAFHPFHAVDGNHDEPAVDVVSALAERIGGWPDAARTEHPALPFVAAGRNAAFLTVKQPFHVPLGSESPLARLYQLNGLILLVGAGHACNASLHLAENWADVPYHRRSRSIRVGDDLWSEMQGSPECSAGFGKLERVLRQARILRETEANGLRIQSMRNQPTVSMAMEMLRGNPEALLCDDPSCDACALARRFTHEHREP